MVNRILIKQIDSDLKETAEEFVHLLKTKGQNALKIEFDLEVQFEGEKRVFYRFIPFQGKPIVSSNTAKMDFSINGSFGL